VRKFIEDITRKICCILWW